MNPLRTSLARFTLVMSLLAMAVAAPLASASGGGCHDSACVQVTGTGLYVSQIEAKFRGSCYIPRSDSGSFRSHVLGTNADGTHYDRYTSSQYVTGTQGGYSDSGICVPTTSTYSPAHKFADGTKICTATQRYSNGSWSNYGDDVACALIHS